MYKECLSNISSYELRNQVEQMLNYSPNFFSDNRYCISFMLSVFSKLFERYTKHSFCFSIDNSVQCILYPNTYATYIKSLIPNDKNSFIIAPLLSYDHLFTCIILKNDTNYECTLVNKGFTDDNYAYTQYTISESDMLEIVPHLNNATMTTGNLYDFFHKHSLSFKSLTNIYSSEQKINNCYYKEIEAGLKYAYSNCYIKDFSVPKWPVSTLNMHKQYISFIMTLDISSQTSRHLKNLYDVYSANKTFREYIAPKKDSSFKVKEILPARFFSKHKDYNDKLRKFNYFKLAFGYQENTQSSFEALYRCLSLVDLKTLRQNLEFFKDLCIDFKLEEHHLVIDTLEDYILGINSGFPSIAPHVQIFFPNATRELTLQYSEHFDILGEVFYEHNDLEKYLKCLETSLTLYPLNTLALSKMGDFYFKENNLNKALEYYSKTLNLMPQSQIMLQKRALTYISTKNFKKALQDCSKLEEINPNNRQIELLKNKCEPYIMTNGKNSISL